MSTLLNFLPWLALGAGVIAVSSFAFALLFARGSQQGRIGEVDDDEVPSLPGLNQYLEPCYPEPTFRPRRSVGGYVESLNDVTSQSQAFGGRVKITLTRATVSQEFHLFLTVEEADRFAEQIRFSTGRAHAQLEGAAS